jgi:large subunit ribosomal protein L6
MIMSRVAKKPIALPKGIQADINFQTSKKVEVASRQELSVKGPKGQKTYVLEHMIAANIRDGQIYIEPKDNTDFANAMAGTTRAHIQNAILGVNQGFERKLTLVGVGYRAQVKGRELNLVLGLSHSVNYEIPEGITIETPIPTEIVVKGIDKQLVGQVAANIRSYRPPEPYKGKGIRYADEQITLKETKKK